MKVILKVQERESEVCGSTGKIAVFRIYKRNGYVHVVSVCDIKLEHSTTSYKRR